MTSFTTSLITVSPATSTSTCSTTVSVTTSFTIFSTATSLITSTGTSFSTTLTTSTSLISESPQAITADNASKASTPTKNRLRFIIYPSYIKSNKYHKKQSCDTGKQPPVNSSREAKTPGQGNIKKIVSLRSV